MTATEIAEYEQTKEMYQKMGINIENEWVMIVLLKGNTRGYFL